VLFGAVLFCFALPRAVDAQQSTADLAPPAAQRDAWLLRLRPWSEIVAGAKPAPADRTDSGLVLDSEVQLICDANARTTKLVQVAFKAFDSAGVKDISDDTIDFKKKEERIFLVAAESVQPDGTRQTVNPNALLLQTPQRQADESLYDDTEELKVIYPNVKPGTITHLIYAVEQRAARIPGRLCEQYSWGWVWPVAFSEYAVDLPDALAPRLNIQTVGQGVPSCVVQSASGRRVYRWQLRNRSALSNEVDRAPARQVGPAVQVTNLDSWNEVARWYQSQLAGRDVIGPKLEQAIRSWTAGAKGRDETVARLHRHIADEVRYVGLEMGTSDVQPHDCNEVWANQYGDCKDKANLLAAALRHVGVPAYVTLVQTEYAGLIERQAPSYWSFDHAIVAYRRTDGSLGFCDPTVAYSEAGEASPYSGDRDALVIEDGLAVWAHVPPCSRPEADYQFDLEAKANGEISGWMTFTTRGYYAAWYRRHYTTLNQEDARDEISKAVRGFYRGAEIVDLSRSAEAPPAAYTLKAYFICPVKGDIAASPPPLTFPQVDPLLNNYGTTASRQTGFFEVRDRTQCTATYRLPPGVRPTVLPPNFSFEGPAAAMHGHWSWADGRCRAQVVIDCTQSLVEPENFAPLYHSVQTFKGWAAQLVPVAPRADAPSTAVAWADVDLPLMPTGDGQLDLINRRLPTSGDLAKRRAALLQALAAYPNEPVTVFDINIDLAYIDWDQDRNQLAYDRLVRLLQSDSSRVGREDVAWAEDLEALALRDLHRTSESVALLEKVIQDPSLTDFRRVSCAESLGPILLADRPDVALQYLRVANALPGTTDVVRALLAHALLMHSADEPVRAYLSSLKMADSAGAPAICVRLLGDAAKWNLAGDKARVGRLADALQATFPSANEDLTKAVIDAQRTAAIGQLADRLAAQLKDPLFVVWLPAKAGTAPASIDDIDRALASAAKAERPAECLRLELGALAVAGADVYTERVWNAANYADWLERKGGEPIDPRVCDRLLDFCDEIPRWDQYYFEGRFLRAHREARLGRAPAARAIFREILASPEADSRYLVPAIDQLGSAEVEAGDYAAARDIYVRAEDFASTNQTAADDLVRAVYLDLHLAQDDEALREIVVLGGLDDSAINEMKLADQARKFISLARSGLAKQYWARSRIWWPTVAAMFSREGLPAAAIDRVVPIPSALAANIRELALSLNAGRWEPMVGITAAGTLARSANSFPHSAGQIANVLWEMMSEPRDPGLPGYRLREMLAASGAIDLGRFSDVIERTAVFEADSPGKDDAAKVAHWEEGYAVVKLRRNPARAIALLESDLAGVEPDSIANLAAGTMADLYEQAGRAKDEEAFLSRARIDARLNEETRKVLQAKLDRLHNSEQFDRAFSQWVEKSKLTWYSAVEPSALKQPDAPRLDEVLAQSDLGSGLPAQSLKVALLGARDQSLPIEERELAWRKCIAILLNSSPTYSEQRQIVNAIGDDTEVARNQQDQQVERILWTDATEGDADDYRSWRKDPRFQRRAHDWADDFALEERLVTVDRSNARSLDSLAASLAQGPVGARSVSAELVLMRCEIALGATDEARRLVDGIESWNLTTDSGFKRDDLELTASREMEAAVHLLPCERALAAVVRRHVPAESALPKAYADLRWRHRFASVSPLPTTRAVRFLLDHSPDRVWNPEFWQAPFMAWGSTGMQVETQTEAAKEGFAAASDDDVASRLGVMFESTLDLDNPAIAKVVLDGLGLHRGSPDFPSTNRILNWLECSLRLRTGAPIDLDEADRDLAGSDSGALMALHLRTLMRDNDSIRLRETLDAAKSSVLLSPSCLNAAVSAFRRLHLTLETQLALRTVKRRVPTAEADAWLVGDYYYTFQAVSLLELADDPSLMDPDWSEHMIHATLDPLVGLEVAQVQAELNRNWTTLAVLAAKSTRDYPTIFLGYWRLGRALVELHREKEAIAPLEVYCHYCHDEPNYADARALLVRLRPAVAGSP
jgi:transglutaminase-like putative cysteine protease